MTDAQALLSPVLPEDGAEAWDEISPDGATLVRWQVTHGRMSHMMIAPSIEDAATGAPLLRLDDGFDGQIGWREGGRFTLSLRHYWRDGTAVLLVDPAAGTFTFTGEDSAPEPIALIGERIEARFRSSGATHGAFAPPRSRAASVVPAVLVLAAAAFLYWVAAA